MDWKALVGNVAPWLGAALGGPLGSAALGSIANALGLSDTTEQTLKSALQGVTPDQIAALKKADQEFELRMRELDITSVKDLEQIAFEDRDSARKREMEIKDNTPRNLAYAMTIGYFGTLVCLLLLKVPQESKDVLYIMLGTLQTAWIASITYYFGSTRGSERKTDAVVKAATNLTGKA